MSEGGHRAPTQAGSSHHGDHGLRNTLITSAATIIAALIGLVAGARSPAIQQVVGSPQPTVTITQTLAPTSDQTGATPTPEVAAQILRQGKLALTVKYCVDLDSSAPDWNVSSSCGTVGAIGGDADLRYIFQQQVVEFLNGADAAPLDPSQPGTEQTCESATNYEGDVKVQEITPGSRFCVRTTSQNRALLSVSSTDARSDDPYNFTRINFDATVWST